MKFQIKSTTFTESEFLSEWPVYEYIAATAAKMGELFAGNDQKIDTKKIAVFHIKHDNRTHCVAVKIYPEENN